MLDPFPRPALHTGWEHPLTVEYVREILPKILGPIEILWSHLGGMEELVKRRGMFPSRVRRFCTQELKVAPFQRYLRKAQDEGEDPVNAIGIRRAESKARSRMEEWDENARFDCEVWRPLIHWTYQDVIDIHLRHGVKPNPLYLRGATRVGCWPCIFARKDEIRLLAEIDPERIDLLERLEGEVYEAARKRHEERGETWSREEYGWFQNPRRRANKAKGIPTAGSLGIRQVVEWAQTARGGKQRELFSPPYAEEGCMRWGLCDTVSEVTP